MKIDCKKIQKIDYPVNRGERTTSTGGLTIVRHRCGKRIELSKAIVNILGNPTNVTFEFYEDYLIVSSNIEGDLIKNMGKSKRCVVYNALLVNKIVNHFNLANDTEDYCGSFAEFEEIDDMDNSIAVKIGFQKAFSQKNEAESCESVSVEEAEKNGSDISKKTLKQKKASYSEKVSQDEAEQKKRR